MILEMIIALSENAIKEVACTLFRALIMAGTCRSPWEVTSILDKKGCCNDVPGCGTALCIVPTR